MEQGLALAELHIETMLAFHAMYPALIRSKLHSTSPLRSLIALPTHHRLAFNRLPSFDHGLATTIRTVSPYHS